MRKNAFTLIELLVVFGIRHHCTADGNFDALAGVGPADWSKGCMP